MNRIFSPLYFLFDMVNAAVDHAMNIDWSDLGDDDASPE